ncbi:AMP-binding protein [Actinomadura sp. 21ATH]|uniref:AMP-binding protein n=1 Tax=Actinomadura sp. 21ATH TaxID=1735444 RepID=UPI0035BF7CCB
MFDGDTGRPAVSDATVTATVLDAARRNALRGGGRPAMVGPGRELGYSRFSVVVPAAAAGLARHGVRPGDVGAIHLADACDTALAVHAVSAAGAIPAPLPPHSSARELAQMLNESRARFLMTGSGEEAVLALAAAERSYVRQVFAFGDLPGATPFARLVDNHELRAPLPDPSPPVDLARDVALRLCDPPAQPTHAERLAELHRLAARAGVEQGDVLACCSWDCTASTWLALMNLCLIQGATFAGVAESDTEALLRDVREHGATLAVVTPDKLRALAREGDPGPGRPRLRLLVTGTADAEDVRACRARLGWTVTDLGRP